MCLAAEASSHKGASGTTGFYTAESDSWNWVFGFFHTPSSSTGWQWAGPTVNGAFWRIVSKDYDNAAAQINRVGLDTLPCDGRIKTSVTDLDAVEFGQRVFWQHTAPNLHHGSRSRSLGPDARVL